MYCPVCGQQQASESMRFCSRCGFTLLGVAEVIANNGIIPFVQPQGTIKLVSPRKRGILQGLFIFLIGTFLVVPILAILTAAVNAEPFLVAITAILSFFGGILRMLYALFFEEGGQATVPNTILPESAKNIVGSFKRPAAQNALPPQSANFNPANNSAYIPPAQQPVPQNRDWRDSNTNELTYPPSVTEDTTKLLEKQE